MAVIEINNLTYTYPMAKRPALREINLSVQEGEFVAIIGANESGKSTLCYAIAGFVPHFYKGEFSGEARVAGLDTQKTPLSELVLKVGLVFQNPFNQISGAKFTVYEEIAFGLENIGIERAEMRRRVEEVMALTGIQDLANRSPYALSGGQQQRVALASILVMQPEVLVLDEPTSQLDPIGTREVFQVIRMLAQRGVTILMAEHKVEWIAEYADRVIALADGAVLREGSPAQVLTDPELAAYGINTSRYTEVARRARAIGLWPAERPLPVTLAEAAEGFRMVEAGHAHSH
jgi:energy-coupling factor transporter ATP-binding protein EcfA2